MQTARYCVLVGLWGENCKWDVSADCKKVCTGWILGRIVRTGSADCKKLCNGGIVGGEL